MLEGAIFQEIRHIILRYIQLWIIFMLYSLLLSSYYGDIRYYINIFYLPISVSQWIGRYHRTLIFESQMHSDLSKKFIYIFYVATKSFFSSKEVIVILFLPMALKKITGIIIKSSDFHTF